MTPTRYRRVVALALVVTITACARETPPADKGSDSAISESGRPIPPAIGTGIATAETPFAFTDADLDAYEKGMRKEIELVKAAKAQGDSAKTPRRTWRRQSGRIRVKHGAGRSAGHRRSGRAVSVHAPHGESRVRDARLPGEDLRPHGDRHGTREPRHEEATLRRPVRRARASVGDGVEGRLDALSRVWIEYMNLVAVNG